MVDLSSQALDIAVKNDIGLFSKSRTAMGHIVVPLTILGDPAQARTEWYGSSYVILKVVMNRLAVMLIAC